jgi:hypothetical protein
MELFRVLPLGSSLRYAPQRSDNGTIPRMGSLHDSKHSRLSRVPSSRMVVVGVAELRPVQPKHRLGSGPRNGTRSNFSRRSYQRVLNASWVV